MKYEFYDPEEYLDQLTEIEKERFFTFNHPKRKCEFVATRILRHKLFGFQHIHYDSHGAPFIENEGYISISHAPGIVGLAISKDFKIGLDIEPKSKKAKLVKRRFLSENEKNILDINSELEMTKVWSAKEVLYKLAGRRQILFKEHLLVDKLEDDKWIGTIINPDQKLRVELTIFDQEELIFSINDSPLFEV